MSDMDAYRTQRLDFVNSVKDDANMSIVDHQVNGDDLEMRVEMTLGDDRDRRATIKIGRYGSGQTLIYRIHVEDDVERTYTAERGWTVFVQLKEEIELVHGEVVERSLA